MDAGGRDTAGLTGSPSPPCHRTGFSPPVTRGSFDVILQGTKTEGLTLGEGARRFATSELCPQFVGTPEMIADRLADLFEDHACDGFVLTPTTFPGMFEQFCRMVVPILQKRGLFRTEYAGSTLPEHLRD